MTTLICKTSLLNRKARRGARQCKEVGDVKNRRGEKEKNMKREKTNWKEDE